MDGKCIIVSAPSGAGKTTLVNALISAGFDLEFSISACSRKPREGEQEGKNYYFISAKDFKEKIKNDEFLEWEEVYPDHYYGTLRQEVDSILKTGKNVIFDVDVVGGLNIKKHYGARALSIFIKPPSINILEDRLKKRKTEDTEKLNLRIAKARHELQFAEQFDKVILNDDLQKATDEIISVVGHFLN